MKTVRNSNAYNKAISDYYGGLAGAVKRQTYLGKMLSGMQAKKYRGGVAAKAKASSNRLFNTYFKPLPQ